MKKVGIIILAVIVLGVILALTLVAQILEFAVGAVLFLVAAGVLFWLYHKVKDKLD